MISKETLQERMRLLKEAEQAKVIENTEVLIINQGLTRNNPITIDINDARKDCTYLNQDEVVEHIRRELHDGGWYTMLIYPKLYIYETQDELNEVQFKVVRGEVLTSIRRVKEFDDSLSLEARVPQAVLETVGEDKLVEYVRQLLVQEEHPFSEKIQHAEANIKKLGWYGFTISFKNVGIWSAS